MRKSDLPVKTALRAPSPSHGERNGRVIGRMFVIAQNAAGAPKLEAAKGPSLALHCLIQDHLLSQDSTVAAPCSVFHSLRPRWFPPFVSMTSPVCGFL